MVCSIKELEDGMKEGYKFGIISKESYKEFKENMKAIMKERHSQLHTKEKR